MKLKFSFCTRMVIALLTLILTSISGIDVHAAYPPIMSYAMQVASMPFNGWLAFDDYADYAKGIDTTELNLPSSPNGDFTLEAWFQISTTFNSTAGEIDIPIIRKRSGYGISLGRQCSNGVLNCKYGFYRWSGSFGNWIPYSGFFSVAKWYHIALVNDGAAGQTRIYLDGALTDTSSGVYSAGVTGDFLLGCLTEGCNGAGNLLSATDEIRISDSVRYTTSFVPTASPFECDGHTRGLWHFDEPAGSTMFHDSCGSEDNFFSGYNGAHTEGVIEYRVYLPLVVR